MKREHLLVSGDGNRRVVTAAEAAAQAAIPGTAIYPLKGGTVQPLEVPEGIGVNLELAEVQADRHASDDLELPS